MDFAIAIAPIVVLIVLMTKRNSTPSHVALPAVAVMVYAIKLAYFGTDANLVNATVVKGLLTAWTPILIIWGAIFMFKTMERSGGMDVIRTWLNGVSDNPVAQLMIIGWAFSFLIEGASGFGTPAALAAPILVGLGFPALRVAILCLIMNSVPVSFGAVGTPTWFGMGQLGLAEEEILRISLYTATIHGAAALVIPLMALLFVVDWRAVRANLGFVYLSVLGCVVPYILLAAVNYEFPALLGGMIGLVSSIALARKRIGLAPGSRGTAAASEGIPLPILAKATFPLWGTVLILVVTRIEQFGLKGFLTDPTPIFERGIGSFAEFSTSASLVLTLDRIFAADSIWVLQLLYIPAILPFFAISFVSFGLFRLGPSTIRRISGETYERMEKPIIALLGALVMVQLLMVGGEESVVVLIGTSFASTIGDNWVYFASLLGAVGSFFSGSATISNLTFSGIQDSIAASLGIDRTIVLSLQSVGGAMGNMVCINNIVAVCTILGIANREGFILKRTILPMIAYALIAALFGLIL